MSLIKILEYGLGKDNSTLNLIISIPKGSYLKSFHIATSADIKSNNVKVHDVFSKVKENLLTESDKNTFINMFKLLETRYEDTPSKTVEVYELRDNFYWDGNIGITVDKDDLTFITMQLHFDSSSDYEVSTKCGEDSTIEVLPVYDGLALKLKALQQAKCFCNCGGHYGINRDFIDTILAIKCFDLAIQTQDYNYAAKLWNSFNMLNNKLNSCNCHVK